MTKLEHLIVKYEPIIYYHIHKMNLWKQFPAYREDMLQEGRMAIVRAVETYENHDNIGALINRTIRNAIYDYVFKTMQLHLYNKNIPYVEGMAKVEFDVELEAQVIREAINQDKNKTILEDYFIKGMNQVEVAERNDVSQQWVSTLVAKFREKVMATWD